MKEKCSTLSHFKYRLFLEVTADVSGSAISESLICSAKVSILLFRNSHKQVEEKLDCLKHILEELSACIK